MDRNGRCCNAGSIDACGVCGGGGKSVDAVGKALVLLLNGSHHPLPWSFQLPAPSDVELDAAAHQFQANSVAKTSLR
jgi:hypothetical protein